jgi:hypothetical protein
VNVYLAASVLDANHDWVTLHARGQVERLRHDRGNRDIPVGILSRGLGWWMARFMTPDIGGAGHLGFRGLAGEGTWAAQGPQVKGGHSSPLEAERRDNVVEWMAGAGSEPDAPLQESTSLFATNSRISMLWLAVIVLFVVALLTGVLWAPLLIGWSFWIGLGLTIAGLVALIAGSAF